MGRSPYWSNESAANMRSTKIWNFPATAVTFVPSTSTTYEAIGSASGTHPTTYAQFAVVRLRSDATYTFTSNGPIKRDIALFDSSGYPLEGDRNLIRQFPAIYDTTSITSFTPQYSGVYYINIAGPSSGTNVPWSLTATEDIGSDSKNTPALLVDAGRPIYRLFNRNTGTHFFTSSENERDNINDTMSSFSYEGVAFNAATDTSSDAITVYRFFNKRTGSHFFTSSEGERDNVIANLADTFSFEGEGYKALPSSSTNPNAKSLFRFFNKVTGSHFYTSSEVERDNVIKTLSSTYNFEGIAYKVLDSSTASAAAPAAQVMPLQSEVELQAAFAEIAPADVKAAIGGFQSSGPQTLTFESGTFSTDAASDYVAMLAPQRNDLAALLAS